MAENFLDSHLTVGELKTLLSGFPDDYHVVLAKDEEGNGFSPLADGDAAFYEAENTWSGDAYFVVGDAFGLDEDAENYNDELPVESANCVVLWPTN